MPTTVSSSISLLGYSVTENLDLTEIALEILDEISLVEDNYR